jgi:hypothetical protein
MRYQRTEAEMDVDCFLRNQKYCPLLKRMHLTFTKWVESHNTRDDGRGANIQILSKT